MVPAFDTLLTQIYIKLSSKILKNNQTCRENVCLNYIKSKNFSNYLHILNNQMNKLHNIRQETFEKKILSYLCKSLISDK